MIFYLDSRSDDILDYVAINGKFIGTLNSLENKISPNDISIEQIAEHQLINEYLVVIIFIKTWKEALIFNADAAKELKEKYKDCQLFWFWLNKQFIKNLLPNIKFKEFERDF